ncbi:MAG: MTH1187 family thiamine-binding protein [Haloferacaceae archaeon]
MTVIAFLSVAPVREGSMAEDVARAVAALEDYPVTYETTPMGTTLEADDVGDLFDAVEAAHRAVPGDRVSTVLKIDDKRESEGSAREKVERVEAALGRPARSTERPGEET